MIFYKNDHYNGFIRLIQKLNIWLVNQILHREVLRANFSIFVIEVSNKHECKLDEISRNYYQMHFSWISIVSEIWVEKLGALNIIIN